MLTIFTTPKPFEGHIDSIQRNAIRSWTLLEPRPEIIVFGDESGAGEACGELGVTHVKEVERNEYGIPLVSDLFYRAQRMAENDLVCYVNADIILFSDFMDAVRRLEGIPVFLMIGRRWGIDIKGSLHFERPDWEHELKERINEEGFLGTDYGIDYFLFTRHLYREIPPLALGRMYWDNWLVFRAKQSKALIVDATEAVTALHQEHDYRHIDALTMYEALMMPEAKRNLRLTGGAGHNISISSASMLLTREGLRRQKWSNYLTIQGLKPILVTNPILGFFFRIIWRIYEPIFRVKISRQARRLART